MERYEPKKPRKYPVNGNRVISQAELYDMLASTVLDGKKDMAAVVEPIILNLEEKGAPQCMKLQSALSTHLEIRQ